MTDETTSDTRVVDGEQQLRVRTTRGVALLFRALVAGGGWYQGAKEFARARKLGKAVPKQTPPTDTEAHEEWAKEPLELWLSDRLREHGRKCLTHHLDRGSFSGFLDDDAVESFIVAMGVSLKDD